ncbi:MAG: hypothetical protein NT062_17360 [Proteobacteria bacterium]|nr:hypothetical protein [Pseudomonadota bacterium]
MSYPRYYAVNDRPVKLVARPTGEVDALVFDFASGGWNAEPSYFAKISGGGDVDGHSQASFDKLVAETRLLSAGKRHARPIAWAATGDAPRPYRASVEGKLFEVRLNADPATPYTLFVDGESIEDLVDWPSAWTKPPGANQP